MQESRDDRKISIYTFDPIMSIQPSMRSPVPDTKRKKRFHIGWPKPDAAGTNIDLIFRAGNGLCDVEDSWFERAQDDELLGLHVKLCAPEEMIWMKAYIMERERFDGADIAHILQSFAEKLDWPHLVHRFGPDWRVLLSHLVLFGYIYPSERAKSLLGLWMI
jgi:hypothetical protein